MQFSALSCQRKPNFYLIPQEQAQIILCTHRTKQPAVRVCGRPGLLQA